MKTTHVALFSMALALAIASSAAAQNESQVVMPTSAEMTAFGYNEYYAPQSGHYGTDQASDASQAQAAAPEAAEEEKPTCRWCRCGKLAEPWTLPQPNVLKEHNVTVGGWLEGGIYANQWGSPSNGPLGFRNVGDGFTADQLWIFAERKTDTKGCGWDFGGRVDYVFGADGPDTQAFGDHTWDYGWNSARDYGSAIPQAYAEVAYNKLKVKGGRFYTLIGYEVVPAPQNFFYSHSYAMYYAEPFTHTGVLGQYDYNDKVTLYGGWVNGWDEGWDGANKGSQFLGGASLKLSEKATLAWMLTAGSIGDGTAFPGAANGDVYMNSIVFTWALSEKLTYVFQHDLGTNYDNGNSDNQWYSISNYLMYKMSDCLSFGGRIEWFQDPQGARVIAGNEGNYYEATTGFNWKPHSNITIRPELRYDWYNGSIGPNGAPFAGGTRDTQLSGGTDFIFTY
jgi:hypothetical protein